MLLVQLLEMMGMMTPDAANDSDSPTDDDATGACVQRVIFMEYSIESGVFCITAKNLTVT